MIRVRRPFVLAGQVPPSKSWLNRALILRSLHEGIRIVEWEPSELDGEDVVHLSRALAALAAGQKEFEIGESGTGFRFLIARLSCEKGVFKVRGTQRLLERPHTVLFDALAAVGTTIVRIDPETIEIHATGWPDRDVEIEIDSSESSQFASALKLAASVFKHEFYLKMTGVPRSTGYLRMTEAMIQSVQLGRRVLVAETDASSVATLATVAVAASEFFSKNSGSRVGSNALQELAVEESKTLQRLRETVLRTFQPDRVVFEFLDRMRSDEGLVAGEANLEGAPDLFPCLAAMSAFAKGTSKFFGAPHLRLKESDRISGVARLFDLVGISYREKDDGMDVDGITPAQEAAFAKLRRQGLAFKFDPLSDHRLAFAAAVLAAGGIPIEVTNRGVVAKSLPFFWTMIEGDAPRIAIIGHRGTGKSEAAKRWAFELGARANLIDLDREIERLAGQSTQDIFDKLGESEFRWFERQAWREVDRETRNSIEAVIVACGAGFDPAMIDDSWTRVWLRRVTDKDGRIFTDRPRLDHRLDPLTESKTRSLAREPRYAKHATRVFEPGEGRRDPAERAWVGDLFDQDLTDTFDDSFEIRGADGPESLSHPSYSGGIAMLGGAVTLLPTDCLSETCERLLRWGVSRIEIRNDHFPLSSEPAAWAFFQTLPSEKIVFSFRNLSETDALISWLETQSSPTSDLPAIDWPLDQEAIVPPRLIALAKAGKTHLVLSMHGSAGVSVTTLEAREAEFNALGVSVTIKLAIQTPDFKSLIPYHTWMQAKRDTRVYLPMTPVQTSDASRAAPAPRWQWYRSHIGRAAPLGLNFWREADGSSLDQPTFSQWWRQSRFKSAKAMRPFAAVLGDPVLHSRTPLEHDAFFTAQGLPVFAIPMARNDVQIALPLLTEMGLKAAAVTSPLKEEIVQGQALNTVAIDGAGKLRTTSTDDVGFAKLWDSTADLRTRLGIEVDPKGAGVVVWGGGGVLKSISSVLPDANSYSASVGKPRDPRKPPITSPNGPDIVIWASGETRGAWPVSWKPRIVVDLSYTENSMGRALAVETGARHVSGLEMFEAQAEAQRKFWIDTKI